MDRVAAHRAEMASDSVRALAEAAAQDHAMRPRGEGPARPILAGVGLDRPFFDDKNRAFWVLQSIGWTGYFFLRSISGLANQMGAMFLVHALLLTATGYSLTLLMASLYRRLITMRAIWTVMISLATVALASAAFSFIETWSYSTFLKPDSKPAGFEYLGAIILDFSILAAWSALYYGINYYLLLEEEIDQRAQLESQASSAQLAMLRYQLNPHFLFNTLHSITALVRIDPADGERALEQFATLLRYVLDVNRQRSEEVPPRRRTGFRAHLSGARATATR
jgi:two-component system, LytTR family, sensor kinase